VTRMRTKQPAASADSSRAHRLPPCRRRRPPLRGMPRHRTARDGVRLMQGSNAEARKTRAGAPLGLEAAAPAAVASPQASSRGPLDAEVARHERVRLGGLHKSCTALEDHVRGSECRSLFRQAAPPHEDDQVGMVMISARSLLRMDGNGDASGRGAQARPTRPCERPVSEGAKHGGSLSNASHSAANLAFSGATHPRGKSSVRRHGESPVHRQWLRVDIGFGKEGRRSSSRSAIPSR
jgi:hypothetical protein